MRQAQDGQRNGWCIRTRASGGCVIVPAKHAIAGPGSLPPAPSTLYPDRWDSANFGVLTRKLPTKALVALTH